ncbi:hypothetical protein GCM10010377_75840 [Streptomyces viridiviolaceus]|uniref:Resolvase/invertase-type recombinase catalytic domain-containing protein n=1 Tax=Streptomyces viridiviolaceus TaxID=68282 RepID=A0ABW2DVJ5_9ACTN|nr:hypothetical protein GCM10010377_75840 [Streptomyces viridiviolaceus]
MVSPLLPSERLAVPAGTTLVLYACLPVSLGAAADRVLDSARRCAVEAECEVVAEYIDRGDPLGDRDGCAGWHQALAAVEEGRAGGVVTPLMVMLGRGKAAHLAAWQRRTGAYLITSSVIDTPEACGLSQHDSVRRPKGVSSSP